MNFELKLKPTSAKLYASLIAGVMVSQIAIAQSSIEPSKILESPKKNWHLMDAEKDNKLGVSSERAYKELLAGKKSKPVVVAIIDSGVDHEHEDLKGNMWVNEAEIPNNGIDDDKNGYIDDIHGWNFIGGKSGNVIEDNMEYVRILSNLKKDFESADSTQAKADRPEDYKLYKKLNKKHTSSVAKKKETIKSFELLVKNYDFCDTQLKGYFKKDDYTLADLKSIKTEDENLKKIVGFMTSLKKGKVDMDGLKEYLKHEQTGLDFHLNENFNSRDIVGDNYADVSERYYGNNDSKGEKSEHGTHVAGIVGAIRGNGLGMDGIATNVKIMSVRTVPDGDERDKDVANAILYAVENGAQIINMSFGKNYSSHPGVVEKAIKAAERAGVLLLHAAGNNSEDNDAIVHYPQHIYADGKKAQNWITVGASDAKKGKSIPGTFSNYGATTVDIFAPGVGILSTTPENQYDIYNGTSMATPVVAGVAALVLSYYPDLTAVQLKKILLESSIKYEDQKVLLPGGKKEKKFIFFTKKEKVKFGTMSTTGGIVNAYTALKMAEEMSKK